MKEFSLPGAPCRVDLTEVQFPGIANPVSLVFSGRVAGVQRAETLVSDWHLVERPAAVPEACSVATLAGVSAAGSLADLVGARAADAEAWSAQLVQSAGLTSLLLHLPGAARQADDVDVWVTESAGGVAVLVHRVQVAPRGLWSDARAAPRTTLEVSSSRAQWTLE